MAASKRYLLFVGVALILTSCDRADPDDTYAQKHELQVLQTEISGLKRRQAELEDANSRLPLKLGDDGFDFVETNAGGGTLEWLGSKDNGNGVALKLRFGNPTAANWNKFSIIGSYGKLGPDGEPLLETTRPLVIDVSQTIPKGSWRTITVQLNGPKAQEVGYLSVRAILVSNLGLNPE